MSATTTGDGQAEVDAGITLEVDAAEDAAKGVNVVEISEAEAREFGIDLSEKPAEAPVESKPIETPPPVVATEPAVAPPRPPRPTEPPRVTRTSQPPKPDPRLQELQDKLKQNEEKQKQTYERLLRATADLDNLRKRTRREIDDAKVEAKTKVIREILPVLDNLERAMAHADAAGEGQDSKGIRAGVELVMRQFVQGLDRLGVKSVDVLHTQFDPNLHEAVGQKESADHPSGTVVEVFQRGYMVGERLLRPALVVVSRVPAVSAVPEPMPTGETGPTAEVDTSAVVSSEHNPEASGETGIAHDLAAPTMVDEPPVVVDVAAVSGDPASAGDKDRPRSSTIPYSGVPADDDSDKPEGEG